MKALLGWLGFLAVVAFLVHGFTRPPSAAQRYVLEQRQRNAEAWQLAQDNARLACAQGVVRACGQIGQ